MRIRALAVAVGAGASIGLLFVFARGPLRSFVGDVVIVVFLIAALAAMNLGTARSRVLGVLAFAVAVELWQGLGWVDPGGHWLLQLTVGSTADPADLVAYALGAALGAAAERWWAVRPA